MAISSKCKVRKTAGSSLLEVLTRGEEGDATEPFKSMNYRRKQREKGEVEGTVLNTTSFLKHGAIIIYMEGHQPP